MSRAWPMVVLGEVLTERKEVPSSVDIETGTTRIISKIGFSEGKIELRSGFETKTGMILIQPGDIVVSGINASKGAIAIYGEENTEPIAATIHYGAYIPNKGRVDTRFLWWLLRSRMFRDILTEYVPGGIKTELKAKRLLPVPVPLPPLSEQKRITARLEELSVKIEEVRGLRRQAVEEAEALVASEICKIFSDEKLKITKGHLGDYVIDDCYGTSEKTKDDDSGTPVLRMGNIQNGSLDIRDLKYLYLNDKEREKLILKDGDILVNRTNSAELVGKCAVFDLKDEFAFASYLIRLRVDRTHAEPRLLAYYINSPIGRAYMFSERKQMTGQANVNATKLKALPISLPSLSEQHRIVAYLDGLQAKVDALKRLQAETSAELNAMLPSVLDRAFKGEWRINDSLYKKLQPIEIHQSRETTLERSTKLSVAAFAAMAYPATDTDRAICAAALAVVEQSGALTSMEHLDALLLATHPNWCKKFLNQNEQRALDKALRSAPKGLFVAQGQSIRWNECRDYLEKLGAITVDHGANNQFVGTGTVMASTKVSFPAGVDEVVKIALDVLDSIRELRKDLASVPQVQRSILEAFAEQHRQYQLAA